MTDTAVDHMNERNGLVRLLARTTSGGRSFLLWIVILALPMLSASAYDVSRYQLALLYILAAVGLNIALGYAGEVVLGHSIIIAAGAYASAIVGERWGTPLPVTVIIAVAIGTAIGMFMMLPGLRVKGWYLTLITFFAVLLVVPVATITEEYSGGEFGLSVPPLMLDGEPLDPRVIYAALAVIATVIMLGVYRLVNSDWELRLKGLRDAPRALQSAGVDLGGVRIAVYMVSAFPAATAGALLPNAQNFVNPETFGMNLALMLITGVILGGKGTFWGPVVGMVPLLAISFWLGPFSPFNTVISGAALVVIALGFPNGLMSAWTTVRSGRRRPGGSEAVAGMEPARLAVVATDQQSTSHRDPSTVEGDAIISLREVSKSFGGFHVLTDISFDVPRGSLTGLVGPNGSGKSTLLNVITGYLTPDRGDVLLNGSSIMSTSPPAIARRGLGRTFQVPQLVPELTVQDNIRLGLLGDGSGRLAGSIFGSRTLSALQRQRREAAYAMARRIGLEHLADTSVQELPLGIKRIVEVGRAAVSQPELLLLDEPAAGLDQDERQQLSELVQSLCAHGVTVMVIEHNVPFILSTCSDVILLREGHVESKESLADHGALSPALQTYLARVE